MLGSGYTDVLEPEEIYICLLCVTRLEPKIGPSPRIKAEDFIRSEDEFNEHLLTERTVQTLAEAAKSHDAASTWRDR